MLTWDLCCEKNFVCLFGFFNGRYIYDDTQVNLIETFVMLTSDKQVVLINFFFSFIYDANIYNNKWTQQPIRPVNVVGICSLIVDSEYERTNSGARFMYVKHW